MESNATVWLGAVATILAAFIGGILLLASTVIAKEQKISEFRQAWINTFRSDMSNYLTLIFDLIYLSNRIANIKKTEPENIKKLNKAIEEQELLITKNYYLLNKISLSLNPSKDSEFISKLKKSKLANDDKKKNDAVKLIKELTIDSHNIIKNEWERTKKGELLYNFFISSGKVLVWASLTAFIFLIINANFPHYCPLVG